MESILVACGSDSDHLEHLEDTLQPLMRAGLKLKKEKCSHRLIFNCTRSLRLFRMHLVQTMLKSYLGHCLIILPNLGEVPSEGGGGGGGQSRSKGVLSARWHVSAAFTKSYVV